MSYDYESETGNKADGCLGCLVTACLMLGIIAIPIMGVLVLALALEGAGVF